MADLHLCIPILPDCLHFTCTFTLHFSKEKAATLFALEGDERGLVMCERQKKNDFTSAPSHVGQAWLLCQLYVASVKYRPAIKKIKWNKKIKKRAGRMRRHLPTQSAPLQVTGPKQPPEAQTHSPLPPTLLPDEIMTQLNRKEREDLIGFGPRSQKRHNWIYTLTHKLERGKLLYAWMHSSSHLLYLHTVT